MNFYRNFSERRHSTNDFRMSAKFKRFGVGERCKMFEMLLIFWVLGKWADIRSCPSLASHQDRLSWRSCGPQFDQNMLRTPWPLRQLTKPNAIKFSAHEPQEGKALRRLVFDLVIDILLLRLLVIVPGVLSRLASRPAESIWSAELLWEM